MIDRSIENIENDFNSIENNCSTLKYPVLGTNCFDIKCIAKDLCKDIQYLRPEQETKKENEILQYIADKINAGELCLIQESAYINFYLIKDTNTDTNRIVNKIVEVGIGCSVKIKETYEKVTRLDVCYYLNRGYVVDII